eukprot:gene30210-37737_t
MTRALLAELGATAAKEEGRAKSEEEAVREDEVAAMERVLEGFELLKADIARCQYLQEDLEEARASWREAAEEEDHKGSSVAECWHQSQQEVMGAVERRVAALEEELAELHSQRRERVPMLRQWCCSVLKRAVRAWTSFVAAAVAKQQRLADAVALCRARSLHEAACQWLRVGTRRRQLRLDAAVEQQ